MSDADFADVPVGRIILGYQARQDLGDLTGLRESIRQRGILTPLTVTAGLVLVFGARRLAAANELGHTTVPCWIARGVSDRLSHILAIKESYEHRKELTPTEQAALYAELRELSAAQARVRQEATRFGAPTLGSPGGGDSPPPGTGKARAKAARAITGRNSYHQHEQVLELQALAADESAPVWLRTQVEQALVDIDRRGKVQGAYLEVRTAQAAYTLRALVSDTSVPALARADAAATLKSLESKPERSAVSQAANTIRRLQAGERSGWADVDPNVRSHLARERLLALIDEHSAQLDRLNAASLASVLNSDDRSRVVAFRDQVDAFTRQILANGAHVPPCGNGPGTRPTRIDGEVSEPGVRLEARGSAHAPG